MNRPDTADYQDGETGEPPVVMGMAAISLWQPWASLIALGLKTIETRGWATNYRGPLAIHAAARKPTALDLGPLKRAFPDIRTRPSVSPTGVQPRLPLGAVVATCRLVECLPMVPAVPIRDFPARPDRVIQVGDEGRLCILDRWPTGGEVVRRLSDERAFGDYTAGRYGWVLEDIRPVNPPIPAKGRQQLWHWTPPHNDADTSVNKRTHNGSSEVSR